MASKTSVTLDPVTANSVTAGARGGQPGLLSCADQWLPTRKGQRTGEARLQGGMTYSPNASRFLGVSDAGDEQRVPNHAPNPADLTRAT